MVSEISCMELYVHDQVIDHSSQLDNASPLSHPRKKASELDAIQMVAM